MNKTAQAIFTKEYHNLLRSTSPAKALENLNKLADLFDKAGKEADADYVDEVVKTAQSWMDLLGGAGGAAPTLWEAYKGGKLFSKETLVKGLTEFLIDTGITVMADGLVSYIQQNVPLINKLVPNDTMKTLAIGALTYAVRSSNFVSKLVDGITNEAEQLMGVKKDDKAPVAKTAPPAAEAPKAPAAQQAAPAVAPAPKQDFDKLFSGQ